MNAKVLAIALAGSCMIAEPGAAQQGWLAYNRHQVIEVGDGVFEVIGRPGSGAANYWCGAGDYIMTRLRQSHRQRIYIWRGVGPSETRPGYKAMQFALRPAPGSEGFEPGYSLSMHAVGDNMRATTAREYCFEGSYEDDGWLLRP